MINTFSGTNRIDEQKFLPHNFTDKGNSLIYYPERGGIVTSLILNGKEIFYQGMLGETLQDSSKSVKGGNPFMFPQAGPVNKGHGYDLLPQHGTARDSVWTLEKGDYDISLKRFVDRENWGDSEYTYALQNQCSFPSSSSFISHITIKNLSHSPMPVAHGYHPYFDIPHGRKDEIAWNFPGGQEVAKAINIWQNGDTYCFDNPCVPLKVTIPGVGKLSIEVSPDFKRFWIWSLPGKSFVCIEPVIGDEDTLINNPLLVKKGTPHNSFMKISLV